MGYYYHYEDKDKSKSYDFEFYHLSHGKFYLSFNIYWSDPNSNFGHKNWASSAFSITDDKIDWNSNFLQEEISVEAKNACDRIMRLKIFL